MTDETPKQTKTRKAKEPQQWRVGVIQVATSSQLLDLSNPKRFIGKTARADAIAYAEKTFNPGNRYIVFSQKGKMREVKKVEDQTSVEVDG